MKNLHLIAAAAMLSVAFFPAPASARQSGAAVGVHCPLPVFKPGEVTRKARVTHHAAPAFTDEARAAQVRGTMHITAVLCRTGRVTDIRVLQGLPHGMTERAVEAVRRVEFEPATKDGRAVSQAITFEYHFNLDGSPAVRPQDWGKHASRPVEELLIEGNRRLTDEQILAHIRTRPGAPFSEATVRRDLQALLDLGKFDPARAHVSTEVGPRGGVVVIFHVAELPVIRSLAFAGLKSISEADIVLAFKARGTGIHPEGVYDPAKVAAARRAILELLAARGRPDASVEVSVSEVSSLSVELTFSVVEGPAAPRSAAR